MANSIIIIDGITYPVNIVSFQETSKFEDKYLNRTEDFNIQRELAGIFFNYEIELGDNQDQEIMQALYTKLHELTDFHTVTLPHNSSSQTFKAYITDTSRKLKKQVDGSNIWGGFTINFVAKAPQITS